MRPSDFRPWPPAAAQLVATRTPARSWILGVYGRVTVTVIFAGLSCWLLIAAHDGSGDLGLAERMTSAVQGLFPLVVALALRQAARYACNRRPQGEELLTTLAGRYADSAKINS